MSNHANTATSSAPTATDIQAVVTGVQDRFSQLLNWHEEQQTQLEAKRQADEQERAEQTAQFAADMQEKRDDLARRLKQRRSEAAKDAAKQRASLDLQQRVLLEQVDEMREQQERLSAKQKYVDELTELLVSQKDALDQEWENAKAIRVAHEQLSAVMERERERVDRQVKRLLADASEHDFDQEPVMPQLTLQREDESASKSKARRIKDEESNSGTNGAEGEKAQRRSGSNVKARRKAA